MDVLLAVIMDLDHPPQTATSKLDAQLANWSSMHGYTTATPSALRNAVLTWTRLHGIVGLELAGALPNMGLDDNLLLDTELDAIIHAA